MAGVNSDHAPPPLNHFADRKHKKTHTHTHTHSQVAPIETFKNINIPALFDQQKKKIGNQNESDSMRNAPGSDASNSLENTLGSI